MTKELEGTIYGQFLQMTYDEKIDFFLKYVIDDKLFNNLDESNKSLVRFILGTGGDRGMQVIFKDEDNVDIMRIITDVYSIMVYEELCVSTNIKGILHNTHLITTKGIAINAKGGWLKHLQKINEEKNEKQNFDKVVKIASKAQVSAAFITVFVISINCYIDWLNYRLSKESKNLNSQKIKEQQIKQQDTLR